jgi:hypothetical protein
MITAAEEAEGCSAGVAQAAFDKTALQVRQVTHENKQRK